MRTMSRAIWREKNKEREIGGEKRDANFLLVNIFQPQIFFQLSFPIRLRDKKPKLNHEIVPRNLLAPVGVLGGVLPHGGNGGESGLVVSGRVSLLPGRDLHINK